MQPTKRNSSHWQISGGKVIVWIKILHFFFKLLSPKYIRNCVKNYLDLAVIRCLQVI
jgi:hypothetical protein